MEAVVHKNNRRNDGRMEILKRAALAETITIFDNYVGLNTAVGVQGEWISQTIIREWVLQGLLEIDGTCGTITAKGHALEYTE
jgi:hypothetical protein